MKYRKLRIAWSVASGIACLLLVVLWIRNLGNRCDEFATPYAYLISAQGRITCAASIARDHFGPYGYQGHEILLSEVYGYGTDGIWGFEFAFLRREVWITVPSWFAPLLAASLAVLPWRRWSYSLRTLLIAMTLIAVALGLLIWAAK